MEKYYLVTIEETISKTVKVKAESIEAAEEKVEKAYENGDVILDYFSAPNEISFIGREVDNALDLYDEI